MSLVEMDTQHGRLYEKITFNSVQTTSFRLQLYAPPFTDECSCLLRRGVNFTLLAFTLPQITREEEEETRAQALLWESLIKHTHLYTLCILCGTLLSLSLSIRRSDAFNRSPINAWTSPSRPKKQPTSVSMRRAGGGDCCIQGEAV